MTTRRFVPLGGLLVSLFLSGCDGDSPTLVEPETEAEEVPAYLGTLPTWAEFAANEPEDEWVDPAPSLYMQQGDLVCTEREAGLTKNPEDLVMFSPDSEVMWLGSLIQGRAHRDGLGSLLELPVRQRGSVDIAIDILFSDNTREVPRPNVASVGQAIGELMDRAETAGHRAGSSIYFSQIESHSFDQATLKLGFSTKYFGPTVKGSLETEKTDSSTTLMASFTQKMFTTSMALPQSPQSVFASDFTPELLQDQIDRGNIGPENLPVYVSSITWGRMLLVEMTSNYELSEMKAALSIAAANDSLGVSGTTKDVLDESEIQVVAIGGHAQAAIDLIRTGKLSEYFKEDAPLTTARPLSYVLRNLTDNSIAQVSETTRYTIRECEAGAVRRFDDLSDWLTAVSDEGLDPLVWETTPQNITASNEVSSPPGADQEMGERLTFLSDSTGLPFDFHLQNRSAATIPDDSYRVEGLVYRDNELPRHDGAADRWISIGDVDGVRGNFVDELQNDDFDVVIERAEAPLYAIGIDIGDNSATGGETITIKGREADGTEFTFVFDEDIPREGFFGFLAPFPILELLFDEDAGGDDIAVRDFRFGVR